jgi:hypothetical protein
VPLITEPHDAGAAGLASLAAPKVKAAWRWARPFPFAVIDNFIEESRRRDLVAAFFEESAEELRAEGYAVLASPQPPAQPVLRAFHEELASAPALTALSALLGEPLVRAESRAYVFQPGHFLLPHTSQARDGRRAVAFVYQIDASLDLEGGELCLHHHLDDRASPEPSGGWAEEGSPPSPIELPARSNRLVLFAVSDASVHEVREVLRGCRLSITGWFYR